MPPKIVYLTPPQLAPDQIKEKIVCIRSHRERMFAIYPQRLGDKLIFHNYGHGGAGWTFLFGSVYHALAQFEEYVYQQSTMKNTSITVLGAGCYGLLTAILLTQKGYTVTVVAAEIENVQSYKSAGFFFPRPRKSANEQERILFNTLGLASYQTYYDIAHGNHPFITQGPRIIPTYFGVDIDPAFEPYRAADLMPPPEPVTIDFGTGKRYSAHCYHTIFINPSVIMDELHRAVKQHSIPIVRRTIDCFDELDSSLIFNCAGQGAKKLTNDPRIVPVQGHLVTLANQPSNEHLQYMLNVKVLSTDLRGRPRDELIYYAPKDSGILGITFIRGAADPAAHVHEFDRLLGRSRDYFGT